MGVFTLTDTHILRLPQAAKKLGISRATFYKQIQEGLLPPGISLGARSVAWLSHELEAVIAARIAGYSTKEIKQLVEDIVEKRQSAVEA